jgi:hypothetical protein
MRRITRLGLAMTALTNDLIVLDQDPASVCSCTNHRFVRKRASLFGKIAWFLFRSTDRRA